MIVRNAIKTYGDKTVLNVPEVSFEPGKIYAIIGANGCGKSTLLKVISATLNSDRNGISIDIGSDNIAYMPQKNYAFKTTVLKNVLLASSNRSADIETANRYMAAMKIDHLKDNRASTLSGGETARMALCRIFLKDSPVVLLDEPTAAMDIESTLLSENLIKSYNKEKGATIIMVTHSINQAERIADEIIFMKDGKIAESGHKEDVLTNPHHPETKEFLDFFKFS